MSRMFGFATAFNGDLSLWNVSEVTEMQFMFVNATAFNGDLSRWDVSKVTNMLRMFYRATTFNGLGCAQTNKGRGSALPNPPNLPNPY